MDYPQLLATLIVACGGAYFGSWLGRRRNDRAIQQQLKTLAEFPGEPKKLATVAEDIKKLISITVLFEAERKLRDVEEALDHLYSVIRSEAVDIANGRTAHVEETAEAVQRWNKALESFDEINLLVKTTCRTETTTAIETFKMLMQGTGMTIIAKRDPEAYENLRTERNRRSEAAKWGIRMQLGVEELWKRLHKSPDPRV